MTLQRFQVSMLPVTPWKNGGGTTRQVACWPPGAGLDDFDWRASIATISMSGPFSAFAGVDRHILLLSGDGVRLRAGDGSFDHRLDRLYEPFAFAGDVAVQSDMLGGVSSDFNVMTRRARLRARVRVLDTPCTLDVADHGLLMSVRGTWRINDETLDVDTGLWWAQTPMAWQLAPASDNARLIAVCWSAPDA